jgi:LacI family transcriptional regulator
MATIVDVARLANVSLSTVSHVINETRPVREDTRRRVVAAIEATGYMQDGVARALRRARTDSVGLVVSDTGQHVFAEMVRGVEHEARAAGFTLLLANSDEDRERELASVQALRERRVDGLLIAQVSGSPHSLVETLRSQGIPVVLLDRLSAPDVDQVGVETVGPMKLLVRHLINRGHRDLALVAGDLGVPTLQERHQGYVEAMLEAGLGPRADRVLTYIVVADEAREAVSRLLVSGESRPTAIVSASNVMTVGTLQALADAGLRVPDDVALATFDEFPHADLFSPRLTSVVQPAFQIGREAMRLLLRRIRRPDAPLRTVRLKPRIVHRDSCGCPRGIRAEWEE